jgi:uncharacterized protein
LPVPAFVEAAKLGPIRLLGFTAQEQRAFMQKFAYFAPFEVPAKTYVGRVQPLQSVAVWNFIAAFDGFDADAIYWLTRDVLEAAPELVQRYAAASETRASNLSANTFMPFHAGALRLFAELGIAVPRLAG